jgi:hypothetical protein
MTKTIGNAKPSLRLARTKIKEAIAALAQANNEIQRYEMVTEPQDCDEAEDDSQSVAQMYQALREQREMKATKPVDSSCRKPLTFSQNQKSKETQDLNKLKKGLSDLVLNLADLEYPGFRNELSDADKKEIEDSVNTEVDKVATVLKGLQSILGSLDGDSDAETK